MQATLDRIDSPEGFILDPSLVLYLPLYRLDGASFMSKDAYGHLCTVSGALWRPDGRYFDGVDDLINCGNDSSLYSADYLTIEQWINPTDAGEGGYGRFRWKHNASIGTEAYMSNAPRVVFGLYTGGVSRTLTTTIDSVPYGSFTYVVMVYDGAHLIAYINGMCDKQVDATGAIDDHSAIALLIGGRPTGIYCFHGLIGEVRIYNRALTLLEIQNHYLATKWRYR